MTRPTRYNSRAGSIDGENSYGRVLARAVNQFTVDVALAPGSATVPPTIGLAITVPPTSRPIKLEWCGYAKVTTGGNGCIGFGVVEMTTNTAVDRGVTTIGGSFIVSASGFSSLYTIQGSAPLPAATIWRTFRLSGIVFKDAGSNLAASMQASNGDGSQSRETWLQAVQA